MFEILGATGIAISMLAYLPQVVHLAKEHCSAGVSSRAWTMWLVSSMLIGALAVHRHDPVFILLQISSLTSAAAILVLGYRYRGLVCESHLRSVAKQWPESNPGSAWDSPAQASSDSIDSPSDGKRRGDADGGTEGIQVGCLPRIRT